MNCDVCERPKRRCVCRFIRRAPTPLNITIIQHADEHKHAKNTGTLAAKCLGIDIVPSHELAHMNWRAKHDVLLFPASEGDSTIDAPELPKDAHIWLIDATWRKATRILAEHTDLAALPRVTLPVSESQWRNRKPQRSGQLATIEAIATLHESCQHHSISDTLNQVFESFQVALEQYKS